MGYYSDVKCVTTREGWRKLSEAVQKVAKDNDELLTEQGDPVEVVNGKYILAEWEYVKWYDDQFKDIEAFMQALRNLENDDIPYRFMRIGENYHDVEFIDYDGENWEQSRDMPQLVLNRTIEVEY